MLRMASVNAKLDSMVSNVTHVTQKMILFVKVSYKKNMNYIEVRFLDLKFNTFIIERLEWGGLAG